MRAKILILSLVLFITSLGISAQEFPRLLKPKWEDAGIASVVILNTTYDKAWEGTLDVLLFRDFKVRGVREPSIHEVITVEKDKGLIIIKGINSMGEKFQYSLKVTFYQKDCNIMIRCQSNSPWKQRIVEKFFELFEKKFNVED